MAFARDRNFKPDRLAIELESHRKMIVKLLSTCHVVATVLILHAGFAAEPKAPREKTTFELGFALFNGYENPDSKRLEGWKMMRESAASGSLKEQIMVADFASGRLTVNPPEVARQFFKPDLSLALDYYRKASDAGDAHAKTELALLYSSGIGEPQNDDEQPHALLLSAARKGSNKAMILLSERYLYGYGVARNFLEAARWRYEGSKNEKLSSPFIDQSGQPKLQDSALLDDFAKVYSMYYRANKFGDRSARTRLDALEAENKK